MPAKVVEFTNQPIRAWVIHGEEGLIGQLRRLVGDVAVIDALSARMVFVAVTNLSAEDQRYIRDCITSE